MSCYNFSNFGLYFTENMNAIGLPAPSSLFGTATTAYANINELASAVSLHGRYITVAEIWGATSKIEKLRTLGPILASYYAGAAAGSAAVALGRSLNCGATISDAMQYLLEHGVYASWIEGELRSNPNFLNPIR